MLFISQETFLLMSHVFLHSYEHRGTYEKSHSILNQLAHFTFNKLCNGKFITSGNTVYLNIFAQVCSTTWIYFISKIVFFYLNFTRFYNWEENMGY